MTNVRSASTRRPKISLLVEQLDNCGQYVVANGDGSMVTPDQLYNLLQKAIGETGIRKVTLHGLRKTFATAAFAAGMSLYELQHRLGHKSPQVTERYIQASPDYLKSSAGEIFKKNSGKIPAKKLMLETAAVEHYRLTN